MQDTDRSRTRAQVNSKLRYCSFAGLTPWRAQGRSEMSLHLVIGPAEVLSHGCSQNELSRQSFLGHSGHMAESTYSSWRDLSVRRSGLTFRHLQISQLRTFCEVSHRENVTLHFSKYHPSCTWVNTLSVINQELWSYVRIGTKKRFIIRQLCGVWKLSLCDHRAMKLTQNCVF